ncbi:MAG: transketolase [Myxococcales bacterium]|nr:transketolase [Myxococcales bacterium]USN49866.1 MAG: transketolase [Myxococcales bacterium]
MRTSAGELYEIAQRLRIDILKMISKAGNGHPGGSLSALDIILELYMNEMHHDAKNPKDPSRDRFVLSKGHGVPALYAVLSHCGYFSHDKLFHLRELGSPLQGHPANRLLDCIEASTGSLGQGLSVALGMALAARVEQEKDHYRVYALLGDGELQEGQVWEALMCASHYKVSNLTAIVDRNQGQIDGLVNNVMNIEPLAERFRSFGWHVLTIDGHDYSQIHQAIKDAHREREHPTMIIANTIKGKGVSFLEADTVAWHGKALSKEELEKAINELGASTCK